MSEVRCLERVADPKWPVQPLIQSLQTIDVFGNHLGLGIGQVLKGWHLAVFAGFPFYFVLYLPGLERLWF